MCTTCSECVTDVYFGVKTHLCNEHTLPCTGAQNTSFKVHVTLTAGCAHTRPCIYACTCMHMHMGAYTRPRHHLPPSIAGTGRCSGPRWRRGALHIFISLALQYVYNIQLVSGKLELCTSIAFSGGNVHNVE